LQAHHQSCAISCNATGANHAWNVSSDLWPLPRYVSGELADQFLVIGAVPNFRWFRFDSIFQFNTLTNALARCPHCRKISSVGVDFARKRSNVYMAFGIIFLAIGIAVAWTTYAYAIVSSSTSPHDVVNNLYDPFQDHTGIFLAYIGMFLVAGLLFARTLYYRRMKVSVIEGPI
jgi:Transmembrane protein 55A